MRRQEEAQELADKILKDSKPWTSISKFKGDFTLFSEEIVRNALDERVRTYEEASEIAEIIVTNSELGTCKELLAALIELVTYEGPWYFVEDVLKYALDDVLIGPIRDWFLEYLRTGSEGAFWTYTSLTKHPRYKEDPQFIEALKEHKYAITDAIRDMHEPDEVLGVLANYPEIIYSDRVLNAIVDWISNEPEACLWEIMKFPSFSREKKIWNKIYPRLEKLEIDFWTVESSFDTTSLLIHEDTRNENIQASRKRLNDLIEMKGWPLMRLSLLSEMNTMTRSFGYEEISGKELEEARQRFFKLLGIEELIGYEGNLGELVSGTQWKGDLEKLSSDIFDTTIGLLEKQIVSGGSTLGIDIAKIENISVSKLIPAILEIRKREMENVEVIIHNKSCVDLRFLWRTRYGSEILKTKKVWKFCSTDTLKEIQKDFEELGYSITITKSEGIESKRRD